MSNPKKNFIASILQWVENVGNRLPDPVTIFIILCFTLIIVSAIASAMGVSVTHPGTKETIEAVSILTPNGIRRIVSEAVTNFVTFPPLGVVLV
ncbi:MAG: AbgT family transporter, partial [Symploca sp. SIO2D2]|nr:AbgT family transporter [Symploca sp. SIO2D2]